MSSAGVVLEPERSDPAHTDGTGTTVDAGASTPVRSAGSVGALALPESIEDKRQVIRRNPNTGVLDRHQHIVHVPDGSHAHLAAFRRELDGVADEV